MIDRPLPAKLQSKFSWLGYNNWFHWEHNNYVKLINCRRHYRKIKKLGTRQFLNNTVDLEQRVGAKRHLAVNTAEIMEKFNRKLER